VVAVEDLEADTAVADHHTDAVDTAAAATVLHEEADTEADTVVDAEDLDIARTRPSLGQGNERPDVRTRYDETSVFVFEQQCILMEGWVERSPNCTGVGPE
jgi:hypothetical protein